MCRGDCDWQSVSGTFDSIFPPEGFGKDFSTSRVVLQATEKQQGQKTCGFTEDQQLYRGTSWFFWPIPACYFDISKLCSLKHVSKFRGDFLLSERRPFQIHITRDSTEKFRRWLMTTFKQSVQEVSGVPCKSWRNKFKMMHFFLEEPTGVDSEFLLFGPQLFEANSGRVYLSSSISPLKEAKVWRGWMWMVLCEGQPPTNHWWR